MISTKVALAAVSGLHARGPLLLDHTVAPTRRALMQWQSAAAVVRRAMTSLSGPEAHADASRALAQAILALYPPRDHQLGFPLTTPAGRPIAGAVAHIRLNAQSAVRIEDMAAAAGLTVRGAQESFKRTVGVRPMELLRMQRLDGVRRALSVTSQQEATVDAIARRWQFQHMGRFAAAYATRFGESPSRTLRRAPADHDQLTEVLC